MTKLSVGLVAVLVLTAGEAFADIGEQGQLAVGAERLTGYIHSSESTDEDGLKTSTTYDDFSLLGMPLAGLVTEYSYPRIGVDYFATDGFSVGGTLTYTHVGTNDELDPDVGPTVKASSSSNVFLIQPRVGYAYMFNESVGIWPRGGITYGRAWSSSDDDDSGSKSSVWALSLEVPFIFALADNVAVLAGPTLDYGFSYSGETTNPNGDTTEDNATNPPHEVGLQAGLTVFF